jgi:hypothetical protein
MSKKRYKAGQLVTIGGSVYRLKFSKIFYACENCREYNECAPCDEQDERWNAVSCLICFGCRLVPIKLNLSVSR